MIELKIKPITGELNLDGLPLEIDTEEGFYKCNLYRELVKHNAVKKIMPNHYLVDSVAFFDKEFQVTIRPVCFGFPFMLHLVDKNSQYYKALNNWNARTNIHMLNESVKSLSDWLKESLNLDTPDTTETDIIRWNFEWGRVSVLYETKSFNHGIYIVWNIT
ncbi:hypothetical protein EKN39_22515 [Enterobacter hormaechei]|uniref:hypothetical protein n=1 Tax=Enterobacter hormaechei TaxID=158836 RepID=UPI00079BE659|nr:hypothetical protein [Enterobacter hormaechei]MBY4583362.1 hypothetical protein [Enterobacter hormaechei]RTP56022.1 hypothetical protein EKN39_22515 [Enterobacter hormaechei]SAI02880.1 Uncharacterised protein [Enterobacter hormaechei]VAF61189.1 Uncharacterised protein [Enterobacter hormaechei]HBL5510400.1 hypothetical protein [Enterobacter hormaechei]